MRSYVLTSGFIFAILVFAHAARLATEGAAPLTQPIFLASTLLAVVMAAWAFWSIRASRR
jgi:hypothetical protein